MESSKGISNLKTSMYTSRQELLPTIVSLTHASASYVDSHVEGSETIQNPMEGQSHHNRCSSESFLEEQPSWLDDLLNEPETLVQKGHRRSASESFAYLVPVANTFNTKKEGNLKNPIAGPCWGSQSLVHHMDPWHGSFDKKQSSSNKEHNKVNESSSLNSLTFSSGHSPPRHGGSLQTSVSSYTAKESEGLPSTAIKKYDQEDYGPQNQEGLTERSNGLQTKPSVCKAETKHAKQQSAHRSRVRKLQYISELERSIQVLQAEGSEVSAELEFLNQKNLILGMENRALRQRLDSLSQEHLIKQLEQDMLEIEIARLQTQYQLQLLQQEQPHQQQHSKHCRNKSRDLDAQFANLSIKN